MRTRTNRKQLGIPLPAFEIQAPGNVYYAGEEMGDLDTEILGKLDPDAQKLALLWNEVGGVIDPASPFRVYAWRPGGQRGRVYLELEFTLGSPFHQEIGVVPEVFDEATRAAIVDKAERLAALFEEQGYEALVTFIKEGSDIDTPIPSVAALELTVDSVDQAIRADQAVRSYIARQDLSPFVY